MEVLLYVGYLHSRRISIRRAAVSRAIQEANRASEVIAKIELC